MDELDAPLRTVSRTATARRTYTTPRVVEFGMLVDITRGGFAGTEDFNFTGTTQTILSPPPPPEEY